MSGVRLEAKVHIVTGADSAAQNIVKCVQRCGLEVEDIVLEQLASSYAVLTEDEKELGVCLVDIGGGTTDIAVFAGGAIRHTAVIPIAGDQVTNDIAVSMRTPTQYAEDIKIRYACALSQLANPDESIEVPSVGRPPGAAPRAPDARRDRRAALRGTVRPDARRAAPQRLRGSRSPPASCSPAAAPRWKARSSSPRRCSTCRCASACRSTCTGLADVVRNPIYSTGVGLLLYARDNALPRRGAALLGRQRQGDARPHEVLVPGEFLSCQFELTIQPI